MSRKLNVFMPSIDLTVSTPYLWHCSEGLTLPNITKETLQTSRILTVTKDSFPELESGDGDGVSLPILVPLGSVISHGKTLKKYAKGKFLLDSPHKKRLKLFPRYDSLKSQYRTLYMFNFKPATLKQPLWAAEGLKDGKFCNLDQNMIGQKYLYFLLRIALIKVNMAWSQLQSNRLKFFS